MKLQSLPVVALILFTFGIAPAYAAKDLDNIGALNQSEFKILSQDLGYALSYKSASTAESLGILGLDVGLSLSSTDLQHLDIWQTATSSSDVPGTLLLPKLQIQKGLPAGFDIGAFYTSVPDTNITLFGGELSYAFLEEGVVAPALAVRGSYSRMSGVDELDLDTTGIELAISKGLKIFTPYAGIGRVWADSAPAASTGLASENLQLNKYFLGTNISLMLFNLSIEIDETDDVTSYNGRLGIRF